MGTSVKDITFTYLLTCISQMNVLKQSAWRFPYNLLLGNNIDIPSHISTNYLLLLRQVRSISILLFIQLWRWTGWFNEAVKYTFWSVNTCQKNFTYPFIHTAMNDPAVLFQAKLDSNSFSSNLVYHRGQRWALCGFEFSPVVSLMFVDWRAIFYLLVSLVSFFLV